MRLSVKNAILAEQFGRCYYCGTPIFFEKCPPENFATLDHKMPKSRGGTNNRTNLVAACMLCNGAKGAKTAKEFMELRI